ncbi:MAG: hypothetical protein ACOVOF_00345 [Chryseotalea sp.]
MKLIISLILSMVVLSSAKADSTQNILQKFKQIQQASQTYKDYKVIKISTLTSWTNQLEVFVQQQNKAVNNLQRDNLQLLQRVENLEKDLLETNAKLKQQEIVQAHVSFAGIDIHKNTWLIFCTVTIGAALAGFSFFAVRNKILIAQLSTKKQELLGLNSEFENLKQHSLEKQIKLSRELQNERNKLEQLKIEMRQSF